MGVAGSREFPARCFNGNFRKLQLMDANGPIPKWIQIVDAKVGKHTLVFLFRHHKKKNIFLKSSSLSYWTPGEF